MLDLSPTKLLIILVVGVVLLGPKRLPQVARQLGAAWRRLRDLHAQIDRDVRQVVPDLPSGRDIARYARSPVALLDRLADLPGDQATAPVEDPAAPGQSDGAPGWSPDALIVDPGAPRPRPAPAGAHPGSTASWPAPGAIDDPSLN